MPWDLILAFAAGWLIKTALDVLGDYLPGRPVDPEITARFRPVAVKLDEKPQRRDKAANILGYRDLGGHYIAPTHPATRGAQNSMQARIAWDGRRRTAA